MLFQIYDFVVVFIWWDK